MRKRKRRVPEVGLFPMCADILHAGHILALKEARKHCQRLIVALNTHPEGKQPVQTVFERYTQLCAVGVVDEVIPYQGREDLERMAACLDYQIRFLGDDYKGRTWDGDVQEMRRGIKHYFIGRGHNFSSTELKERVVKAKISAQEAPHDRA